MNATRIRQALDLAYTIITEDMTCVEERNGSNPDKLNIDKWCQLDLVFYRRCLRAVKLIDEALKEIEA